MVSIDTLRADALRTYDARAAPLPVLDALAARSVRFRHAFSAAAWTLPAQASLLTGTYPHRHGAIHRYATLSPQVPALAALLAARGYETAAFTDGGFLDARYGFGRGFERYDDHLAKGVEPAAGVPAAGRPNADGSSDLFARAIAFLHQRPPSPRPLLLFAHTYAVHDYYRNAGVDGASQGHLLDCLVGRAACEPREWQALSASYRRAVARVDGALGQLLGAVDAAFAGRATWVVVVSDHGEGLDPSGPTHHGGALDPTVLEVPLLIRGPVRPRDVRAPVSLVDVAPTIVALSGGGAAGFDGRSLVPLLTPGVGARLERFELLRRTLRAEEHFYWWRGGSRHEARDVRPLPVAVAMLRNGWWYAREPGGERLVAVTRAQEPGLGGMRSTARDWLHQPATSTTRRASSRELEATLRSLGYGGGSP